MMMMMMMMMMMTYKMIFNTTQNGGRDSSVGVATTLGGWTFRGSNPGRGRDFSLPVQTGLEAYPVSCTMGTGCFSVLKRPERGAHHPPASTAGWGMGWSYTYFCPLCLHRATFTFTTQNSA